MEVGRFSSDVVALERMVSSFVGAVVVETLLTAQRSLACFLVLTGSLLNDFNGLPELFGIDARFPIDKLHRRKQPGPENKDASDTEDDDEDEGEDDDQDDDGDDEDFSGEEGGDDDDDEGDPEEDPAANGNAGSDGEDDDDDDGDDDDEGDEEDEDEDDEDEDEEDQPPAKKRK